MRKTLVIFAMCVKVALNAENEDPVFESDTTGKVNFKKTALF